MVFDHDFLPNSRYIYHELDETQVVATNSSIPAVRGWVRGRKRKKIVAKRQRRGIRRFMTKCKTRKEDIKISSAFRSSDYDSDFCVRAFAAVGSVRISVDSNPDASLSTVRGWSSSTESLYKTDKKILIKRHLR
jgi:hypothetical protein